jgi:hypothetical protein
MEKPETTSASTDADAKYDELIRAIRNDPNFHRLPLPESVRKRFDIPLLASELSLKEATVRAFTPA